MGCCHPIHNEKIEPEPIVYPVVTNEKSLIMTEHFAYYVKSKENKGKYDKKVKSIKRSIPVLKSIEESNLLVKRKDSNRTKASGSESRSEHHEEMLEVYA